MSPNRQDASVSTLARELASVLDKTLERELADALGRTNAHDHTKALYRDDAHVVANVLARAANNARGLDDVLYRPNRPNSLGVARGLARDIVRDINHARELDRNPARDLDRDLARARNFALLLDRALMRAMDQVEESGREHRSVLERVMPPARRLVAVAACLLPAGERARYGREWHSELHDLASAGAGPHQQVGYAVRLLVRAVPLRVAVLAPRREKASP